MKKKQIILLSQFIFIIATTFGNNKIDLKNSIAFKNYNRTTVASPLENDYDIHFVKLDLQLSNTNTSILGNATTQATVLNPLGMSQYAFELTDALTIDSIEFNGVNYLSTTNGLGLRTINLITPLPFGSSFTVQIFYQGNSPSGTGFFTHGLIQNSVSGNITYSVSDMYLAKDWWPSKQALQDKIDSAVIWITCPINTLACSNGLRTGITSIDATHNRHEWKTNYPIEYYLISVAIAPYTEHTQQVHFAGSTDSMMVQHFIYDTVNSYPAYLSAIDSTPYFIDYFSVLFGRYPFWKEKYGHAMAKGLGGGMEHQTMTSIDDIAMSTNLISHELGHQWWGNSVTYNSWKDIWLSEGFASYCEELYVEHFRGTNAFNTYRTNRFNRVLSQIGGSVYIPIDTNNASRVFDNRLTYDKGSAVMHMLRFNAPNDSLFFKLLKTYQQQYQYKTATTADLNLLANQIYGKNMDTFFNQWIYGEGYPIYNLKWNQINQQINIKINQTSSKPSIIPFFQTPLEIKIKSLNGDTVFTIWNNQSTQNFNLFWDKQATGIVVDPNNNILDKTNSIQYDSTLFINERKLDQIKIYPNPTQDFWNLENLPNNCQLSLFDWSGKEIWNQKVNSNDFQINIKNQANGLYLLKIQSNFEIKTLKISKQNQ